MVRRVTAFLAIVAIVVIVLAVMWRVYRHHEEAAPRDVPTIVDAAEPLSRCIAASLIC